MKELKKNSKILEYTVNTILSDATFFLMKKNRVEIIILISIKK